MESAALSRADQSAASRQTSHHLMIDEFSQFMAQSEESLTRMLSETRKYNLFCVMAHQNWSQASDRLKGALQNVGLEVILKAGRMDAEYSARLLGRVDPLSVKHEVHDEQAIERTHPSYYSLAEQWEHYVQAIQTLKTGQAYLRLPDDRVVKVQTPHIAAWRPDRRHWRKSSASTCPGSFDPVPAHRAGPPPATKRSSPEKVRLRSPAAATAERERPDQQEDHTGRERVPARDGDRCHIVADTAVSAPPGKPGKPGVNRSPERTAAARSEASGGD